MSKLTIAAGAATVAVASLAYLLLKQRKVGKELFSMLITEDEDGMNKAAGLDAGPFPGIGTQLCASSEPLALACGRVCGTRDLLLFV